MQMDWSERLSIWFPVIAHPCSSILSESYSFNTMKPSFKNEKKRKNNVRFNDCVEDLTRKLSRGI